MTENNIKVKKRKRATDAHTKPSKRVALEPDTQVKISFKQKDQCAPIIASTPGLAIPPFISLKPYSKSRPHPTKGRDTFTHEVLLHSSDHPTLDYIAREDEPDGPDACLRHYVGVYDPETCKLEVMETRKMTVRVIARAHQYDPQEKKSSLNMRDQRNALGQEFGTKKARKAIASITENAISDRSSRKIANGEPSKLDATAAVMMANMAEATQQMSTAEELARIANEAKPRPKANESATEVKDVYTIDSLIGVDTIKLIPAREWHDAAKKGSEIVVISRFVANRILSVSSDVEKLKILRYMLLLLEIFHSAKITKDGRLLPKRSELKELIGDVPDAVLEGIKCKFTEAGRMHKYHCDLMITHLCALALVVDNFETDTYDLKEDLKIEMPNMIKYFREIGAKITPVGAAQVQRLGKVLASQRKLAKLRLPLEFPKLTTWGRKRVR